MARISQAELDRFRGIDAGTALMKLAEHVKQDPTFDPVSAEATTRWHASIGGLNYELLLTGPKFYDTRQKRGGGGAIDLVMHLYNLDFKRAVERCRAVL